MQNKIIVLGSSEISVSMSEKCIARAKEFGFKLDIFNAIHGADAPEIIKELGLRQYRAKMKGGRLGVLGCFLSHYFLWHECVEAREPFMIFEHDAYMLRPLPKKVLKLFPDILKLDSLDPYRDTYNADLDAQGREDTIWSLHDRLDHGKHIHNKGLYSIGGYGYIIKPHAAKHLIEKVSLNGFRPADHQIHTTDKIDIHHIAPSVVRIHADYAADSAMKTMSLTRNLEANSNR